MVRRRYESEAEFRRPRSPSSTRIPSRSTGTGTSRPAGEKAVARADGARVIEPHAVAGIEQHAGDQLEALLRAADDEDLLRLAGDAAVGAQMRRDGPGSGVKKNGSP